MTPAIAIHDLCVTFPTRKGMVCALDHVSLTVTPGTVFGFLGPNGAGKTTTMHVLLGFVKPTSGEAFIFGANVKESIARERIGYLPENPDTYTFLTGRELLLFTGRFFRMTRGAIAARTEALLEETGLAEAADRRIALYSRGMRQRLCLAQALINDPDLLILDEPTGGLDPLGRRDIRRIIARCRDAGKTVFFSSHELSEVELVCDHVAILARGRRVAEGPLTDLVPSGERLETFFVKAVTAPSSSDRREMA